MTVPFYSSFFSFFKFYLNFQRARAQNLVCSLSLIMVDASLGAIQCLEEIVSICIV